MSSWDEYHGLMQAITSLWRICWYLQKECSGRGELTDKHKSSKNITAGKTLTFWPSFMEQLEGKPRVQFSAAAYPSSHKLIWGMSIFHSSGSITWRCSHAAPHSCDRITRGWQSNKKHILTILKNLSRHSTENGHLFMVSINCECGYIESTGFASIPVVLLHWWQCNIFC